MEPVAKTMVVTPICTHNMRFSSYVLSPEHTLTVELERNDQYKGNSDGKKPTIQKLTATTITNGEMFDDLVSGEVDVLNKVMSAEELQKGYMYKDTILRHSMVKVAN